MYDFQSFQIIAKHLSDSKWMAKESNSIFVSRLSANLREIQEIYDDLYANHPDCSAQFASLIDAIMMAHNNRTDAQKREDHHKLQKDHWITSNDMVGMSLYVDRFATDIVGVASRIDYFEELGVNLLHLMPLMKSPIGESDGGYAVSDFRDIDPRFGKMSELHELIGSMKDRGMYLMLDIVLNHTSDQHQWAKEASAGNPKYQNYYYIYDTRAIPDQFEQAMPEIFPESSPGNFTYDEKSGKWVMTVFNSYQWDLNFTNPSVLVDMVDTIFFYANLGVDVLRIDAPAFIWKRVGTNCQNLPEAHALLQLIKLCVQAATPGMALLGEAIVAPKEIMKYFGTGRYYGKECDLAYNATQMALQWDALASGDTRIMIAAQHDILQKPMGVTWLTYTRCHDDIGLGYDDKMIAAAGFDVFQHRKFIKEYYAGNYASSLSKGALFGVNEKTNDARISGSLASLCGLEVALTLKDDKIISKSIEKIMLMQAMSIVLGGIPMLFYGDEVGYTNDYSFMSDPGKSYDNRWMHRPVIDWQKNELRHQKNTPESIIFNGLKRLIALRKLFSVFADKNNITWMEQRSHHIAAFVRYDHDDKVMCLFNFSQNEAYVTWYIFKNIGLKLNDALIDIWSDEQYVIGRDDQYLRLAPYQFMLLKMK
jgi:amylosucrase